MADGLSFAASIIAVLGAAEGLSKALSRVRRLRHAPNELLALINEVSDLRIILGDVQTFAIQNESNPQLSRHHIQHLFVLVDRAKETLLELDKLIHFNLMKPQASQTQIKVAKREWLKATPTIERFRHSLRDIRLNIATHMVLMNSSHQSRIGLTIDEIRIISTQLSVHERSSSTRVHQQLDEQYGLLNGILRGQADIQNQIQLQKASIEQAQSLPMPGTPGRVPRVSPESQRLDSVIRVRVHAHQSQRSPCLPYCRCACHHVQVFRSSNSLHNAVGALFIGYAGYPFQALQECTEACSTSKSSSEVYVYYVFPTWLLTRAVAFTIGKIPHGNINLNLSTRRVIPIGAEIFRLIKFNDVDNIKELLRLGLASPYDSDKSGISVLASAVNHRCWKSCDLLLRAGADPYLTTFDGFRSAFNTAWNYILEGSGTPAEIDLMRSLFPDHAALLDERGLSSLHKTVLKLDYCDLKQQIQKYKGQIDDVDSNGFTALIWAARRGDSESLKILVQAGADVHIKNCLGSSALHYAGRFLGLESVELLLRAGAEPCKVDIDGNCALRYAAASMHVAAAETVHCLIEAGADRNRRGNYGTTPLHEAALFNHAVVAKALLDHGADTDLLDDDGDSAFLQSIHCNAEDVTQLLLSRGANYTAWDSMGNSMLHVAALSGGCRTLDILREAKLQYIDPDAFNRQGRTVLQLARARASIPVDFIEKLQELLADIRARNKDLQQAKRASPAVEPDGWIQRKKLQLVKKINLILNHRATRLQHRIRSLYHQAIRFISSISRADVVLIALLSALGLLGLFCVRHVLDPVTRGIAFVWSILGPGDASEL